MSNLSNSKLEHIIERGKGLTGTMIDNNYRLLYYSSSVQNDGQTLRLHRDINDSVRSIQGVPDISTANPTDTYSLPTGVPNDFDDICLVVGGSSGNISISGNTNNNIITATGNANTLQGETNLSFDGSKLTITGSIEMDTGAGKKNVFIGNSAGLNAGSNNTSSVLIGDTAGLGLTGHKNVAVGAFALDAAGATSFTTAVGIDALGGISSGNFNTALGAQVGSNVTSGNSNVLIGYNAGPSSGTALSNKLYINNSSGTPLILGDFSTGHVSIKTALSASIVSGSFVGDGSNLTGLSISAFPYNGDALITGSLTVSGSSVVVNFKDALAVSASVFSGSFVGDGSSLTGVNTNAFPHTGSAVISGSLQVESAAAVTGSFTVSGSSPAITLAGVTTIDRGIKVHRPAVNSIGLGANTLSTSSCTNNVALGFNSACAIDQTGPNNITVVGSSAAIKAGNNTTSIGASSLGTNQGSNNTSVGYESMGASSGQNSAGNTAVGAQALKAINNGDENTGIGKHSLKQVSTGQDNTGVGTCTLDTLGTGNYNVAIGKKAGSNVVSGDSNVYIGYKAGPSALNTTESNKLYINNEQGTPLIKGDFSTGHLIVSGAVSSSAFSGSFFGDGTNLTGVTAEWDGSINGDAVITGSLTVSGSSKVVDFTNVTAISGSNFSGSFAGDGSGLTGLTGLEWNGRRNGNADISGSLIVSGAVDVGGTLTISSGSYPGGPGVELIQVNASGLTSTTTIYSFLVNATTGYTGFKADYVLTNAAEDSKKVGTLLGSWDRSGNNVINDEHTLATGIVVGTSFDVSSNASTAALKLNIPSGTFELNTLITAFKRIV